MPMFALLRKLAANRTLLNVLIVRDITISNLLLHLVALGILLAVMTAFYSVHFSALWIFLYMAMLLMFAQGLGWIVAGLQVFLRDTIQALQIVMLLWFYFTPILYTMD